MSQVVVLPKGGIMFRSKVEVMFTLFDMLNVIVIALGRHKNFEKKEELLRYADKLAEEGSINGITRLAKKYHSHRGKAENCLEKLFPTEFADYKKKEALAAG